MLVEAPPVGVDVEGFGAGSEPHIRDAEDGNLDVLAEGMGGDAVAGELLEFGIEGGGEGVVDVVAAKDCAGLSILLRRIEGSGGEVGDVDGVLAGLPVDVAGGDELDGPGAEPAVEAVGYELAGVVDAAGGQAAGRRGRSASCGWSRG